MWFNECNKFETQIWIVDNMLILLIWGNYLKKIEILSFGVALKQKKKTTQNAKANIKIKKWKYKLNMLK